MEWRKTQAVTRKETNKRYGTHRANKRQNGANKRGRGARDVSRRSCAVNKSRKAIQRIGEEKLIVIRLHISICGRHYSFSSSEDMR